MDANSYPAICAQMNSALEIRALVNFLNYQPEKLKREGDIFLAMCPIHRDTVFRTLVLNPRNNTYQCRYQACPGNHAADFLDLVVRVQRVTLPEAIDALVKHFGPSYFRLNISQLETIAGLLAMVREENQG